MEPGTVSGQGVLILTLFAYLHSIFTLMQAEREATTICPGALLIDFEKNSLYRKDPQLNRRSKGMWFKKEETSEVWKHIEMTELR